MLKHSFNKSLKLTISIHLKLLPKYENYLIPTHSPLLVKLNVDLLNIKYVYCDENEEESVQITDGLLLSQCRSMYMIITVGNN